MKRILVFFFASYSLLSFAQTQWAIMGSQYFSGNIVSSWGAMATSFNFLSTDKNGILYCVYRDSYAGGKATVKKYDGNDWITVGIPGFSLGNANTPTIAFDANGTPYVVYQDSGYNYRPTVMKFDGTNWVNVGNPGFSDSSVSYTSIAIDSSGTPYVAFRDVAHNYGASVMKFNGTSWVYIGMPGFTHAVLDYGGAASTTVSFDKNGVLYLAYEDDSNGYKATVKKFDGVNWVDVGTPGFAFWNAQYSKSMCFGSDNTPYIVCSVASKATVKKFDGTNWVNLGSPSFSQGYADYASIAIDSNNTIYVSYQDYANGHKETVMKYDGLNWVTVGTAGFSPADAWYQTIAIDASQNPVVVFADGSINHYCATAMRFENSTTVGVTATENNSAINIYPNPTTNVFTVCYNGDCNNVTVTIRNVLGESILTKKYSSQKELKESFDLSKEGKGVYFVEVMAEEGMFNQKIIVQ